MITEKLKKKILRAVGDKAQLESAQEDARKAQAALSLAADVWKRTQLDLLSEIENFDKNMGNHLFSIDGTTYLVLSGYGNPVNVDVQIIAVEEYKERKTERTLRDSIT